MMLKKLLTATILMSSMALAPAVMNAAPTPKPKPAAAPAPPERHPHIRAAIRELEAAKHELQTAAHDFGGHRKEAVEAVDNALKQLREALEYDKN